MYTTLQIAGITLIFMTAYSILKTLIKGKYTKHGGGTSYGTTDNEASAYQRKWMFTQHEKGAYFALKNLVEPMGYIVFAKVRLWDLVEPRNANDLKSRGKIQAKHCDFVLVDKKLVARAVVELDDSTHDKPDRQMRDQFVDGVLTSCGYKVFHTRNIKDREFQEELKKSLSGNAANINERG